MSLGIAFKGPEEIVLAADSRVTLTTQMKANGQTFLLPSTYDNATKLLHFDSQPYVGAVTYGAGAMGESEPRTAHSFLPEFEAKLEGEARLGVQEFSQRLSDFFMEQWKALMPKKYVGPDMVFLVGGYDDGAPYGRVYELKIPAVPAPREMMSPAGFGLTWGGQREFADRLIQGFDDALPALLQSKLGLSDKDRDALRAELKAQLGVKVPFQFLPLQDCVDLSIFLIRTTIEMQSKIIGIRGVGGAIDVATITRTGGFGAIQKKEVGGETT